MLIGAVFSGGSIVSLLTNKEPIKISEWQYASDQSTLAVRHSNNMIYVADLKGFYIINGENPYSPEVVYSNTTIGAIRTIEIDGDRLFLSSNDYGVNIYNISTPSTPVFLGKYNTTLIEDIIIMNNTVLLDTFGKGLLFLNISNIQSPQIIANFSTIYYNSIVIKDHLLIGSHSGGLEIRNLTTISTLPSIVNFSINHLGVICVRENVIYGALSQSIIAIDITNIAHPIQTWEYESSGETTGVSNYLYQDGSKLYAEWLDQDNLFIVFDLTNPTSPRVEKIGIHPTQEVPVFWFRGIFVINNFVYIAERNHGLFCYDVNQTIGMYLAPISLGIGIPALVIGIILFKRKLKTI